MARLSNLVKEDMGSGLMLMEKSVHKSVQDAGTVQTIFRCVDVICQRYEEGK